MVRGRQEDALHFRGQSAVHVRQLEFVFEVGDRTQATQDDGGALFPDEVGQQVAETGDGHVGQVGRCLSDQFTAFFEVEEGLLLGVVGDGDDDFVEHAAGAFDEVGVAVGDWVEGARIDDFGHAQLLSSLGAIISALPVVL